MRKRGEKGRTSKTQIALGRILLTQSSSNLQFLERNVSSRIDSVCESALSSSHMAEASILGLETTALNRGDDL